VKNMKRNAQQGFTLIELMIVIAIVAILVALAVPAYQDYAVRAKVGECIGLGASAKLAVEEYLQSEGIMPANETDAGLDIFTATEMCSAMTQAAGIITITTIALQTGEPSDTILTLTPDLDSTGLRIFDWICTSDGEKRHVPASCRG
jgi:prepilin-type N-terminal cleavage/methylation domain-containing protein